MMVCSLYDPATGIVQQTVTVAERQLAVDTANALGLQIVDEEIDGRTQYIVQPEPLVLGTRENVDIESSHSLSVGEVWVVEDVPEGTQLYVDGEFTGTIDDGTAEISFALAGTYQLELRPPSPGQSGYCEVEVS